MRTELSRRLMWIAWPAFLLAGVIEIVVFAMVDPRQLQWFGQPLVLSREAAYTLAFFVFWALAMLCSALTVLLAMSPLEINRGPQWVKGPAEETPERT